MPHFFFSLSLSPCVSLSNVVVVQRMQRQKRRGGYALFCLLLSRDGGGGGRVLNVRRHRQKSFTTNQSSMNHIQRRRENESKTKKDKWVELIAQTTTTPTKGGAESLIINPCNSESHPAVRLGLAKIDRAKPKRSLQEAYDPFASCFVCSKSGRLRLETRRTKDAKILQSKLENGVPETYVELPGIVAPGMIASVMSCAGSWHGSIALMDKAVLARPPLMMLEKMLDFTAVDVLAPNEKCSVQSEIVSLDEPNFATVKLEMTVGGHTHEQDTDTITSTNSTSTRESKQHVCARAVMRFKKIGAVRSIS